MLPASDLPAVPVDREHLVSDRLGISYVPSVEWVDEEGRAARLPTDLAPLDLTVARAARGKETFNRASGRRRGGRTVTACCPVHTGTPRAVLGRGRGHGEGSPAVVGAAAT